MGRQGKVAADDGGSRADLLPHRLEVPLRSRSSTRLVSLDVFRGLTLAFMIVVVTPGSWSHRFAPLRHAAWDGLTAADLVFPFFLFMVGVSTAFSLSQRMKSGDGRGRIVRHVLSRTAIIFMLGLAVSFDYPTYSLRIPGVLQRIAICYLAVALILLMTQARNVRLGIGAALIAVYWILMKYVPVPGFGAGRLVLEGNMCGYIDAWLMKGHLYMPMQEPGPDFDPEGLLSTLPAIVTTLVGSLVGEWIREKKAVPFELSTGIFAAGTTLCAAGYVLQASFPVNKALWSPSYALVTAGIASLFLAFLYWLVDIKKQRAWTFPFLALGANTIAVYWLSSMMSVVVLRWWGAQKPIIAHLFTWTAFPELGSLAFAVCYLVLWTVIAAVLYRKGIIVKV